MQSFASSPNLDCIFELNSVRKDTRKPDGPFNAESFCNSRTPQLGVDEEHPTATFCQHDCEIYCRRCFSLSRNCGRHHDSLRTTVKICELEMRPQLTEAFRPVTELVALGDQWLTFYSAVRGERSKNASSQGPLDIIQTSDFSIQQLAQKGIRSTY
ncbi:hypothetical protein ASG79_10635 [Arthrobacter sp. Soil761]|nr:hypothetical protein ASG79_10635 [Arthrobacter sp. Soil761]